MRAWFAAVVLGLVAVVACSETEGASTFPENVTADAAPPQEDGACCDGLCVAGFETSFAVDVNEATLQGSTLSLCHNADCFEASFADLDLRQTGSARFVDPRSGSRVDGASVFVIYDEPRRLQVRYEPWSGFVSKDGDVYQVSLKSGEGVDLYRREQAVTYTKRHFCCQVCDRATFDGADGGVDGGDAGDAGDGGR